jgi:hypothetical protein
MPFVNLSGLTIAPSIILPGFFFAKSCFVSTGGGARTVYLRNPQNRRVSRSEELMETGTGRGRKLLLGCIAKLEGLPLFVETGTIIDKQMWGAFGARGLGGTSQGWMLRHLFFLFLEKYSTSF